MGSAYLPVSAVERQLVGNTTIVNPKLLLTVNNVTYLDGYSSNGRYYFLAYESSSGNIYLVCNTIVVTSDNPSVTLPSIGVLIVG